jgi:hypothetical protein
VEEALRGEEIRCAIGVFTRHDLSQQLARPSSVLEAVTTVPAGHDHTWTVSEASDEELPVR